MLQVWRQGERLIIAHRYGGCYDVVEVDDMGAIVEMELSELPEDAVRLVDEGEQ